MKKDGKFISVYTSAAGRLNANFALSINLPEDSSYEIVYYVYVYCVQSNCAGAGDSITVTLSNNKVNPMQVVHDYSNIGIEKKWMIQSRYLILAKGSLDVNFY
jgi:hypothetical protein